MSRAKLDVDTSRKAVAEAITRVKAPVAFVIGFLLLGLYLVWRDPAILVIGLTAVSVGLASRFERSRSPVIPLLVSVTGLILTIPLADTLMTMAVLSALTYLAMVGVFSLSKPSAFWFSFLCVGGGIYALASNATSGSGVDLVVAVMVLVGVAVSGWKVLNLFRDTLMEERRNYRLLFDTSPVALLEEDFTEVHSWLGSLRGKGIRDLRSHLMANPNETRHGASLIRIVRVNEAAVEMIEAGSADELVAGFAGAQRGDAELPSFLEQFVAIWTGQRSLALDLKGTTMKGRPLEAVMHWAVPETAGIADFSRVSVAISDVTPRKVVEERLTEAVESNARLLSFEQALAACSRALLLGVGEDALEVALESLRAAIGADRAFLSVNLDDRELGPSFKVVESASAPEHSRDDWVGMVVPWSRYPTAAEPLSRGESFQHLAAQHEGEGWSRSLLIVPVQTNGEWTGTVGFVDIDRRTHWTPEALRMLEVASPMLGNFWERELTRRRLEDLVQSKDRFVATISHELRTPLSAVLGFAEELKSQAATFEPHEATEILELIAEQSRDMADMVEDLLVAARAEIGTVTVEPEVVYLRAQAEAALVALGSTGPTTVKVVGGPGRVWADPSRTKQVIRNLLTNALRYGGSEVEIEAVSDGPMTRLRVWDSGDALSTSEWERIFEPYQRAHDRPARNGSVGLGLSVSRQLARLMGGDLVYRGDATGSTFEFSLPSRPFRQDASSSGGAADRVTTAGVPETT